MSNRYFSKKLVTASLINIAVFSLAVLWKFKEKSYIDGGFSEN